MGETTLEARLVRKVKAIGGKAPKWVSPGNKGVPDRLVILPGGRTIYVEMKDTGKKYMPLQKKWADDLRKLGHTVYKLDCDEDIDRFIAEVSRE